MAIRNYQPEQMHRISYTKLSEAQIDQQLRATAEGPKSQANVSATLVNKRISIITDDGPSLEYHFHSNNELSVSENGSASVKAGYSALDSKQLVLFSHMLPDTQRGYNVVIDQDSNLVTVFEVWFSGYEDNREVQREVYYGYVDAGDETPTDRHHITNRLEGKGIAWKQDDGIETLEFFTSVVYTNFIELSRFGGEMTICAPADYIMINDHQFIYSRVECEFSGTFTLYIIDLFGVSQTGVRLGFNTEDELEYYLYKGTGKVTGQTATFEVFGNNGEEIDYGNRPKPTVKGQRLVYRPLKTFPVMTDDEVKDQVLNHADAFGDGQGTGPVGMGGYKTPISNHFVGKNLTVRMDNNGPALEYHFDTERQLRWRYAGDTNWREAWYEMYEPDEELYFFAHLLDLEFPRQCAMVALDMKNGLSTYINGKTGTPYRNNETTPTFHFGVIEMEGITPPTYKRHGWTDELIGETVTWNYQPGDPGLTSMHLYATPSTYSWIIFLGDGSGGLQWSSPGWYTKLREDVYIMAWVEEACNGTLGVICYNKRTMHDAGFDYHVGPNGLKLSTIGARARHAGKFDVEKYLGHKG